MFAHQMAAMLTSLTGSLPFELASAFSSHAQKAIHVETSLGAAGLSVFPQALCEIIGAQLHAKASHSEDEVTREVTRQALQALPQAKSLLGIECDAQVPEGAPSSKATVLLDLMTGR